MSAAQPRAGRVAAGPSPGEAAELLSTPPPRVDTALAEAALLRHYGLVGRASILAAERDRNFMVTLADGTRRVFKVYNAAEDAAAREFQNGVLLHMERVGVACAVPRLVPTREGAVDCGVAVGGHDHRAILISVVPGEARDLSGASPSLRRDLGRVAAEVGTALAGYDHPAARRVLLWDPMQLGRLAGVVELIPDPAQRRWLAGVVERFVAEVRPRALALPAQVIHNDMSGSNVLVDGDRVSGVIDFGDMVLAPRVNEVAIASNYAVAADRDPLAAIADVVEGYEAVRALAEAEVALLYDLVLARLAVRVLMYRWRAELFPENRDYILRNGATGARLAEAFAGLAPGAGRDALLKRWTSGRRMP